MGAKRIHKHIHVSVSIYTKTQAARFGHFLIRLLSILTSPAEKNVKIGSLKKAFCLYQSFVQWVLSRRTNEMEAELLEKQSCCLPVCAVSSLWTPHSSSPAAPAWSHIGPHSPPKPPSLQPCRRSHWKQLLQGLCCSLSEDWLWGK